MKAELISIADNPYVEDYARYLSRMPSMFDDARYAAENEAVSHSGFPVGVSMCVVNPSTAEFDTMSGANVKPTQHPTTICAETITRGKIVKRTGGTRILGMVVAATLDKVKLAKVNTLDTPIIVPCFPCVTRFGPDRLIDPSTIITGIGLEEDVFQTMFFSELEAAYATPGSGGLEDLVVCRGFKNWGRKEKTFEALVRSENVLPIRKQRPLPMMAKMAILS